MVKTQLLLYISFLFLLSAIRAQSMTEPTAYSTNVSPESVPTGTPAESQAVTDLTTLLENTETNPDTPATDQGQTSQVVGDGDTTPGTQPTDPDEVTVTIEETDPSQTPGDQVTNPDDGDTTPATQPSDPDEVTVTIEETNPSQTPGDQVTNPDDVTGPGSTVTDDGESGGTTGPAVTPTPTTASTTTTQDPGSPSTAPPILEDKTLNMELSIKMPGEYNETEKGDWRISSFTELNTVYAENGGSEYGFDAVEITDISSGSVLIDYTVKFKLQYILEEGISAARIAQEYIIDQVLPAMLQPTFKINNVEPNESYLNETFRIAVEAEEAKIGDAISDPCAQVNGLCGYGYTCTKAGTTNDITCTYACASDSCHGDADCFAIMSEGGKLNTYEPLCRCKDKYIPFPGDSCVDEGLVIGLSVGIGGAVIIGLIIALIVVSKTKKSIPQIKYLEVDKSKGVISDDGKDEEIELGVESTTLTGLHRHDSNLSEVPEPYTGKNGHINNAYMENGPHYHDIPANIVTSKPDEVSEPDVVPQSTLKPRKPEPEPPRNDTYKSRIDRYSDYRSPDRYTDDRKNDRYPYDNRDNRDNGRYETDIDDDPVIRNFEPQLQNVDHSRPIHIKRPKINLTPMDNNSRSPSSAHTSARQSYNDEPPYGYHRSFDGRY